MELEPRTAAPVHATGAVEFVPLTAIADDGTFRLRGEGDVADLAASIGRLGQLSPVELRPLPGAGGDGPRFQVVAGFRRLAALRLLMRERVLARVHETLHDEDAWALALAQALLGEPLQRGELEALRGRLADADVAPWADELIDEAVVRAPVEPEVRERLLELVQALPPEDGAESPAEEAAVEAEGDDTIEVTPEELADDLAQRLFEVNQDLAVAFDAWRDLPVEGRRQIVDQARWITQLFPLLEREED